jgi:hypothetical protein
MDYVNTKQQIGYFKHIVLLYFLQGMANKLLLDLGVCQRRDNNLCLGDRSVRLQITLESILSQEIVGSLVANIGTEVIWQSMPCAFLRIDVDIGRFGV